MSESFQSLEFCLDIVRRRRLLIFFVGVCLFALATAVAILWPPTYRSTATILIIEQEVPSDFVRSTITSYADQQIERIKAQVMSRSRLYPIIEEHNLYEDLREHDTSAAALEEFIDDIRIEVMSADVVDRRTGRPTQATIAFTLSYEGSAPYITQKIANELTTLFLNENLKNREQQVQQATAFLKQESEKLANSLQQFEKKIAEFKNKANGALPELFQMNMQLLSQVERELIEKNQQAQVQEERILYLEGELARRKSELQIKPDGSLSLREQLKALRHQYASLASHLSQEHPDIIKLKGEIEALEGIVGKPSDSRELSEELKNEELKLSKLLEKYGDDHPDVIRARSTIVLLKEQTTDTTSSGSDSEDDNLYDPTYVTLMTQLATAKTTFAHLSASKKRLEKRVSEYAARVELTPEIEPTYQALVRERDNAAKKFQEYRSRLLEAQVAEGLELERKGERFSLVDPPSLPEEPIRPNRKAIIFLGLVLALAGGVGSAVLAESLDDSIRSVDRLRAIAKIPTLGVIPYLSTREEQRARIRARSLFGVGALVLTAVSLVMIHVFWLPLDVIWYTALRKLRIG
ncbi:MAG: hypothetical protein MRJ96_11505 [Nitrospirales bacterium]|nr:hypothetical protein [Nitrospira sp.]MDR4502065.1 hypothetical protein [Nitrospirales bacterium]